MIKVNLAVRKRSPLSKDGAGSGGGNFNFNSGKVLDLFDKAKELPLRRLGVPIAVCIALWVSLGSYEDGQVKEQDAELAKVNAEKPALEIEIAKMKAYEDEKKQLEADEEVLKRKLEAIRKLVDGRNRTVLALANISKIIPPSIWLTDVTFRDTDINIKGQAVDFDPITEFEHLVGESGYFREPTSRSAQDDQTRLVTFELSAKKRQ